MSWGKSQEEKGEDCEKRAATRHPPAARRGETLLLDTHLFQTLGLKTSES